MLEQVKEFEGNALALKIVDAFTEEDENLAQKFFNEKLERGFENLNLLIDISEWKITKTNFKAGLEDLKFVLKNLHKIGNIAIVGHSKIEKLLVPIDNWFYKKICKGKEERYFDISQMKVAIEFVTT